MGAVLWHSCSVQPCSDDDERGPGCWHMSGCCASVKESDGAASRPRGRSGCWKALVVRPSTPSTARCCCCGCGCRILVLFLRSPRQLLAHPFKGLKRRRKLGWHVTLQEESAPGPSTARRDRPRRPTAADRTPVVGVSFARSVAELNSRCTHLLVAGHAARRYDGLYQRQRRARNNFQHQRADHCVTRNPRGQESGA
jgi:hypothetical protein